MRNRCWDKPSVNSRRIGGLHPKDHWTSPEDAAGLCYLPLEPFSSQHQVELSYMYLKNWLGHFVRILSNFVYTGNPVNKVGHFLSETDWLHLATWMISLKCRYDHVPFTCLSKLRSLHWRLTILMIKTQFCYKICTAFMYEFCLFSFCAALPLPLFFYCHYPSYILLCFLMPQSLCIWCCLCPEYVSFSSSTGYLLPLLHLSAQL